MCGAASFDSQLKLDLAARGFYFDDTGNNISHLNPYLGDLTGLYWVWKNTQDPIVGTNQYRRPWSNEELLGTKFDPDTVYVARRTPFTELAYDQYVRYHGHYGINLLITLARQNVIDLPHVNDLKNINYLHCNNMFIAHRDLFNIVCQRIFTLADILYPRLTSIIRTAGPYQRRTIAYLTERALTVMFNNPTYYIGQVKIQEISWSLIPAG